MIDNDPYLYDLTQLREKIAELQIERDEARRERDDALRSMEVRWSVHTNMQDSLKDFAEEHLDEGSDEYKALSELMSDYGMSGLKRTFTVTVRVSYDFEVEVEASDEDEARDLVDNDITTYAKDLVHLSDSPDDIDIDAIDASE